MKNLTKGISVLPLHYTGNVWKKQCDLKHAYNLHRIAVIPFGNLDAGRISRRVHDLSVSDIHGYMINAGTAGVKQQVARLHLTGVHCVTLGCLRTGRTVHADACAMLP